MKRSSHLSLLECFQIAVDAPLRSCVALVLDFSPKDQAVVFSIVPAFEDIRHERVQFALDRGASAWWGIGEALQLRIAANALEA